MLGYEKSSYEYRQLSWGYHMTDRIRQQPILSIVTVSFNCLSTISQTLDSVKREQERLVEYIVIDGSSTDGTQSILIENRDIIDILISEPDSGLYDAMNKGAFLSSGRYIMFLNADDYLEPGALKKLLSALDSEKSYHNTIFFGATRVVCSKKTEQAILRFSWSRLRKRFRRNPFPHPSAIVSRDIFMQCHGFDLQYKIASDYDFFLRALSFKPSIYVLNDVLSNMRKGGVSDEDGGIKSWITHQSELCKIQSKHISLIRVSYFAGLRAVKYGIRRLLMPRLYLVIFLPFLMV